MKYFSFCILGIVVGLALMIGCAAPEKETQQVAHPGFEQLCSQCHTLDRVAAAHQALSQQQMRAIVDRMARKPHSGIDLHDIDDIVEEIY